MALTINKNTMIFSYRKKRKKAFVSKEKDWATEEDESDEEEFINLAFMADSEDQEASSSTS